MRVLRSIAELSQIPGPVVLSIGVFDGVHLGHQAVIGQSQKSATACDGSAVVLTFEPHPARFLRPERAPRLLTSTAHKQRLIAALGVEWLLLVPFNEDFAAQEPADFIRALARSCPSLRQICVGHQWAFGRGRAGSVDLLRQLGAELGFAVNEMPPVALDGEIISSTRIRRAVEEGDFGTARRCLGRDFTILGTVEAGQRLGRAIGFPTANLRAHNEQFPPDGVYAVRAALDGQRLTGVANIGFRPTVAETPSRTLEVHFFDFDADIYGEDVEVTFVKHLRAERKFDGIEALKNQIASDVATARELLSAG